MINLPPLILRMRPHYHQRRRKIMKMKSLQRKTSVQMRMKSWERNLLRRKTIGMNPQMRMIMRRTLQKRKTPKRNVKKSPQKRRTSRKNNQQKKTLERTQWRKNPSLRLPAGSGEGVVGCVVLPAQWTPLASTCQQLLEVLFSKYCNVYFIFPFFCQQV